MNKICIVLVVCLAVFATASHKAQNLHKLRSEIRKGCCKCQLPKTGCCDCNHQFVSDYIDVPEPAVDAVPMTDSSSGEARVPIVDKMVFTESPQMDFGNNHRGTEMISAIAMLPDSPAGLQGSIILTESTASSESSQESSFPADKATTKGGPCDGCTGAAGESDGCKKFECGQMYGMTSGTDYSTLSAPGGAMHTTCDCSAGVHCPCAGGTERGPADVRTDGF